MAYSNSSNPKLHGIAHDEINRPLALPGRLNPLIRCAAGSPLTEIPTSCSPIPANRHLTTFTRLHLAPTGIQMELL